MNAPIVIFVYNRPNHVKRLIESLIQNSLAKESDLYIYSDAPKNENNKEKVDEVRKYILGLNNKNWFKQVNIICAKNNLGLANSIINGVSEVIKKYGKVIVLEDDLMVSPYFLDYMNQALETYQNEKRVFSVSGFSRDIEYLRDINADMYFSNRAQSWSWGTWIDRWDKINWNVPEYKLFKFDLKQRREFNKGGDDMSSMLDRQQCNFINSWAIRFCFYQYLNDGYSVQPRLTLVSNAGQDGSGSNCNYIRETSNISLQNKWKFRNFDEDSNINRELKKTRKFIPKWKLLGSFFVFVVCKGYILPKKYLR